MEERKRILELIEAGQISVEEGVRRLEALEEGDETADISPGPVVHPALVRALWQAVFSLGTVMVVGGGLLVAAVYAWGIAAGWLACGWPLFAFGVLGLALGWWMRKAHWFSLRVRQRDGSRISLALPLPLGPVAWLLRVAGSFIPRLRETGVDELILAMEEELHGGRSFTVEVDEGEEGEQVHVYFG